MLSKDKMQEVESIYDSSLKEQCTLANSVYVPVYCGKGFPLESVTNDSITPCLNKIARYGCHGSVISPYTSRKHGVLSTMYRAYTVEENNVTDIENYYEDMFSLLDCALMRPYSRGDKNIWVDPDKPGNMGMFALIASRQPWESPRFLEAYKRCRRYFHPLVAAYIAQFVKYTETIRSSLGSDHDLFREYLSVNKLVDFIREGKYYSNRSSFNRGDKRGVTLLFSDDRGIGLGFSKNPTAFIPQYKVKKKTDIFGACVDSCDIDDLLPPIIEDMEINISKLNTEVQKLLRN